MVAQVREVAEATCRSGRFWIFFEGLATRTGFPDESGYEVGKK